jgi:hypothetical protein
MNPVGDSFLSRKEKLLSRLYKLPPPKDFRWSEFVTLMRAAGFKEHCEGGSHFIFEHVEMRLRFSMSKTHPSGVLKRYQIENAKEALEKIHIETKGL